MKSLNLQKRRLPNYKLDNKYLPRHIYLNGFGTKGRFLFGFMLLMGKIQPINIVYLSKDLLTRQK